MSSYNGYICTNVRYNGKHKNRFVIWHIQGNLCKQRDIFCIIWWLHLHSIISAKKGSQSKYFSRSGYTSVSNSITLLFDTLNLFFAAVYIICLQGLKIVPLTAAVAWNSIINFAQIFGQWNSQLSSNLQLSKVTKGKFFEK